MDNKIITILERLEKRVGKIEESVTTLESLEKKVSRIEASMATKNDLQVLKKELIEYTDGWCTDLLHSVNRSKADETEVRDLKVRVRNLERKVAID